MMNQDAKTETATAYEPTEQQIVPTESQLCSARYSPCGKYLVGGGYDGKIYRWEMTGEKAVALEPLAGHNGWPTTLAFHPTSGLVFTADSWGQIRATDYAEEKPKPKWTLPTAHDGWVRSLAVSPDGKLLASVGLDQLVRLYSTADGKLVRELAGQGADIYSVAFHPAGKSLVTGDLQGVVREWNVADGKSVRDLDASVLCKQLRDQECGGALQLAFSPSGNRLAVGGLQPTISGTVRGVPTVLLFDWTPGKLTDTLEYGEDIDAFVHGIHFTSEEEFMLVTSGTPGRGQFIVQRIGEEEPLYRSNKMQNSHSLSLSPDGLRLAVATTNRGSNGNGRRLDKEGNYLCNTSPIYILELPTESETNSDSESNPTSE